MAEEGCVGRDVMYVDEGENFIGYEYLCLLFVDSGNDSMLIIC